MAARAALWPRMGSPCPPGGHVLLLPALPSLSCARLHCRLRWRPSHGATQARGGRGHARRWLDPSASSRGSGLQRLLQDCEPARLKTCEPEDIMSCQFSMSSLPRSSSLSTSLPLAGCRPHSARSNTNDVSHCHYRHCGCATAATEIGAPLGAASPTVALGVLRLRSRGDPHPVDRLTV